jgi:hypothetical protein
MTHYPYIRVCYNAVPTGPRNATQMPASLGYPKRVCQEKSTRRRIAFFGGRGAKFVYYANSWISWNGPSISTGHTVIPS